MCCMLSFTADSSLLLHTDVFILFFFSFFLLISNKRSPWNCLRGVHDFNHEEESLCWTQKGAAQYPKCCDLLPLCFPCTSFWGFFIFHQSFLHDVATTNKNLSGNLCLSAVVLLEWNVHFYDTVSLNVWIREGLEWAAGWYSTVRTPLLYKKTSLTISLVH